MKLIKRLIELRKALDANQINLGEFSEGCQIAQGNSSLMEIRVAILEFESLQATVEKLPKTADGVIVKHGMKVWLIHPDGIDDGTVCFHVCDEGGFSAIQKCYSTREAAEAAKKGEPHER